MSQDLVITAEYQPQSTSQAPIVKHVFTLLNASGGVQATQTKTAPVPTVTFASVPWGTGYKVMGRDLDATGAPVGTQVSIGPFDHLDPAGPPVASIGVDVTAVKPGGKLVATLSNGPGGPKDWLGLCLLTAPDVAGNFPKWAQVPAGQKAMTWTPSMPSAPGSYHVRLFANDGYTRLAVSPTLVSSVASSATVVLSIPADKTVTLTRRNANANKTILLTVNKDEVVSVNGVVVP